MDRQALITKLAKCQHNPIKDVKTLEAFSDEGLTALEAHCTKETTTFAALEERAETAEGELKTLQEKVSASDAQLKTLQADLKKAQKPLSEEEWMKLAPQAIRSLVERQQELDEKRKSELVETLKTAQEEFTEEELKAMSVNELDRTARLLKIDEPVAVDFSGARRAAPINRAAADKDKTNPHLNPPDAYAAGIEKLRASQQRH